MTTRERWFAIAAVALAALFGIVSVGEDTQLGVELDRPFVVPAEQLARLPSGLVNALRLPGSPEMTVVLALLLGVGLFARGKRREAAAALVLFAATVGVEWLIRRWAFDYPSGHTARFAYLAIAAAGFLPRRWGIPGLLVAAAATLLMALQRVATDAHTGTDVIGGALLGAAFACLFVSNAWRGALARVPGTASVFR